MRFFAKNGGCTCCFTGHRTIPESLRDDLKKRLRSAIVDMIEKNSVTVFIAGGALGFDMMAEIEVLELKKIYPHIKLCLAIPCKNQTKGWSIPAKKIYNDIMHRADEVIYTGEEYTPGCMYARNRYMVDRSDYCISYKNRENGGTAYTVKYAISKGKAVINMEF